MSIATLQERLDQHIRPFGYHSEAFHSVHGGWTFQIKKGDEIWNCQYKDLRDESLATIVRNLGHIQ